MTDSDNYRSIAISSLLSKLLDYVRAFGYADDIALVAPSIYCLKEMVNVCEQFAHEYRISFNPSKSNLVS